MKLFQPRVIRAYQEIKPDTLEMWLISADSSERELADIELSRMPKAERKVRLTHILEQERKARASRQLNAKMIRIIPQFLAMIVFMISSIFFKKNMYPIYIMGGLTALSAFFVYRENQLKESSLQKRVAECLQELQTGESEPISQVKSGSIYAPTSSGTIDNYIKQRVLR